MITSPTGPTQASYNFSLNHFSHQKFPILFLFLFKDIGLVLILHKEPRKCSAMATRN